MLLDINLSNLVLICWGLYDAGYSPGQSGHRNVSTTVTVPYSYYSFFQAVITPFDKDYEGQTDLETSASCVYVESKTRFQAKVYGLTAADLPYGFYWHTIGY